MNHIQNALRTVARLFDSFAHLLYVSITQLRNGISSKLPKRMVARAREKGNMKMLFSRGDRQNDIVNINLAPSLRSFSLCYRSLSPEAKKSIWSPDRAISILIATSLCVFGVRCALSILEAFVERRRLIVRP